jgi:hypothetical protein
MVEREDIERFGVASDHERISFLVVYISEHQRDFYPCAYTVNSTYSNALENHAWMRNLDVQVDQSHNKQQKDDIRIV